MRTFPLLPKTLGLPLLAALFAVSASADLSVSCRVVSEGREIGTCATRISNPVGTGEHKIDAGNRYALSEDAKCPLAEYDLVLANASWWKFEPTTGGSLEREFEPFLASYAKARFKVSLVRYRKPNRADPKTVESERLVDGRDRFDLKLEHVADGNGLRCTITNR